MPYNRKAFGVVISRLRVEKGLTQEQMSGLAGIARSHLAALENGQKTVKLDTMWRIADALEIRPGELITRIEKEGEKGTEARKNGGMNNTRKTDSGCRRPYPAGYGWRIFRTSFRVGWRCRKPGKTQKTGKTAGRKIRTRRTTDAGEVERSDGRFV